MSLTAALRSASSGLQAAQTTVGVVSDNIANVNTAGYVRKLVSQQQLVLGGAGAGVEVTGIKRAADQYLQSASLTASADAERWSTVSEQLDSAQSLFGDPASDTGFFSGLDGILGAFQSLADDPSSSLLRSQATSEIQDFFTAADRIGDQLAGMQRSVDSQASATVDRANSLLDQIAGLNGDIGRAKASGADTTGSENLQSQLIDELAGLMDVKLSARSSGGVDVRSGAGVLLAGDGAAKLTYDANATDHVTVQPDGSPTSQPMQVSSGVLRGLIDLRDDDLPGLVDQLNAFTASTADQLNAAHNDSTAVPPPATLTGRDMGVDLPTAVTGFTGSASVVLVDRTANTTTRTIDIDFDAGTISVDGAAGVAFTPADFLDQLNTALGSAGSASFTDGKLSLNATGGAGVAIDEGTSAKDGRGFSHTFGLNDLVVSDGAGGYQVRSDIAADPKQLAAGKVNASAAVGAVSVAPGDGSGAQALAAAGEVKIDFPAAGDLGALSTTLSDYAAQFGGAVGRAAATAESRAESSEAVASQATARRQSAEGVNLDEELVNLTTYQQAYAASAKLIQAISEMFDDLFKIV